MADVTATTGHAFPPREESRIALGGSLTEASSGAAAVILAVLGLLQIAPAELMSIATIVVGASLLLLLGAVIGARFAQMAMAESLSVRETISEGMVTEWLCGATGIVLGILALVGTHAAVLVPIAAIVFGAGLLVAAGTVTRLAPLATRHEGHYPEALYVTPAPGMLAAFAGIILGILALSGFDPVTLSLVAMLTFGVAVILTGTSFATMMFTTFWAEADR